MKIIFFLNDEVKRARWRRELIFWIWNEWWKSQINFFLLSFLSSFSSIFFFFFFLLFFLIFFFFLLSFFFLLPPLTTVKLLQLQEKREGDFEERKRKKKKDTFFTFVPFFFLVPFTFVPFCFFLRRGPQDQKMKKEFSKERWRKKTFYRNRNYFLVKAPFFLFSFLLDYNHFPLDCNHVFHWSQSLWF